MSKAGPDGCRALILKVIVTMSDGSTHSIETQPAGWEARAGPVTWDHFFHGEDFDGRVDLDWLPTKPTKPTKFTTPPTPTRPITMPTRPPMQPTPTPTGLSWGAAEWHPSVTSVTSVTSSYQRAAAEWHPARVVAPAATSPAGMQVTAPDGSAVAIGALRPNLAPPLRVMERLRALSVRATTANDTASTAYVFDFGRNMAGMVRLRCNDRNSNLGPRTRIAMRLSR